MITIVTPTVCDVSTNHSTALTMAGHGGEFPFGRQDGAGIGAGTGLGGHGTLGILGTDLIHTVLGILGIGHIHTDLGIRDTIL